MTLSVWQTTCVETRLEIGSQEWGKVQEFYGVPEIIKVPMQILFIESWGLQRRCAGKTFVYDPGNNK